MSSFLLAFASSEGQTRRIVQQLSQQLTQRGIGVDTCNLSEAAPPPAEVASADVLIVAGSVHLGRHQDSVERFVHANHDALQSKPSAFLSISLAAAEGLPAAGNDGLGDPEAQIAEFLKRTQWQPTLSRSLAGAIRFSSQPAPKRWGFAALQRLFGRRLAREGYPDLTRDQEYTLLAEVVEVGESLAALAP